MWFADGNRFTFVRLRDLADEVNSDNPRLRLPSFQRDAAWDERHVELLWDSILRGFPIGAILVAQRPEGVSARRLQRARAEHARPTEDVDVDLVLIDGQQRSASIAIGFRTWRSGDPCRLWIDLYPPQEKEGLRFRMLLCSLLRPWARDATDPQKRDAVATLPPPGLPEEDLLLGTTWPLRAVAPVPMAEFIAAVAGPDRDAWKNLMPVARREKASNDPNVTAFVEEVREAVTGLNGYQVPALLLDKLGSVNDLGAAFHRLNRQGVPMSAEDLFFSGLKLHWPGAHDLVWDIYRDEQTGRFLTPTKIVHAATRLATMLRTEKRRDVVRLDIDEFRRLIESEQGASDGAFLSNVRYYLEQDAAPRTVGRLHGYLRLVKATLVYRPVTSSASPDDAGLPLPLLARLRWRTWHTLVAWLAAGDRSVVDDRSREEMIRYVLLDLFFMKRDTDTSLSTSLLAAINSAHDAFPGRLIHEALHEAGLISPVLLSPEQFCATVEGGPGEPCGEVLNNENLLVMFAQRRSVARWYSRFDPTRYVSADDLPYDMDHMLAAAHLARRGRRNERLAKDLYKYRDRVANGAGNFRVWPKSENRADRDRNLKDKHLLGPFEDTLPANCSLRQQPYGLETYGDVREASFLPEGDLAIWQRLAFAPGGDHDWDDPARLEAMREAMTRRRAAMYRRMFEDATFVLWLGTTESI